MAYYSFKVNSIIRTIANSEKEARLNLYKTFKELLPNNVYVYDYDIDKYLGEIKEEEIAISYE